MNSGNWWWTGRPGMLQFMGLQRVGHNWVTELNWTENGLFQPFTLECESSLLTLFIRNLAHNWVVVIPDQQLFCWLFVVIPDHHLFCKSPHSTSIAVLTSIYLSSLLNSPLHCPANCSVLSWTTALASNLASLASAVNLPSIGPLHNSKDDNPSCLSNPWLAIFLWLS